MTPSPPRLAYLALGSNLGDRAGHLRAALLFLRAVEGLAVTGVSRVYETEPVGGPVQDDYLNAVVAVETAAGARQLLEIAQALEAEAGREPDPSRRVRWGARPLDVDVLLVGDETVDEPDLIVPHPRMSERAFVLAPLADLAPEHPVVARARARFRHGWPGVRVADVELGDEGGD